MMFPHTVTVYNLSETPEDFRTTTNITILRGVLYDAQKAANVRASGLEAADAVNLYIPFDVTAVDGADADMENPPHKHYVSPKRYEAADDKTGLWTLDVGNNCFFVKGEVVVYGQSFQHINANYDDVNKVTKVDTKDFGSLQHWEIGGS